MAVYDYSMFIANPIFAGFASADSDRQALISQLLEDAELRLPSGVWGTVWERAVFLLTAHQLTYYDAHLAPNRDANIAGDVARLVQSQESRSVTFKEAASRNTWNQTAWGQLLLELRDQFTVRSGFVA